MNNFELKPIGTVLSRLTDPYAAPPQADEGAPVAELLFNADVIEGLQDLVVGSDILLLTWLHLADRRVLSVHPRSDPARPREGVFSTRSPDRPNPIGLHRVTITAIARGRICVGSLEAVHGTPIVDIKPVLSEDPDLR